MPDAWESIMAALAAAGGSGGPRPLLTGKETDAELRALVLRFTRQCPVGEMSRHCPFYILNGLPYATIKTIVERMSRQSLIEMFDDERQCRKDHAAECFQPRKPLFPRT